MKVLERDIDWNNNLSCDFFLNISILDDVDVSEVVAIMVDERVIKSSKCIFKIKTKLEKLTDLVCLCCYGYNSEYTKELIKAMNKSDIDWSEQVIYIYGFTNKHTIYDAFMEDNRIIQALKKNNRK